MVVRPLGAREQSLDPWLLEPGEPTPVHQRASRHLRGELPEFGPLPAATTMQEMSTADTTMMTSSATSPDLVYLPRSCDFGGLEAQELLAITDGGTGALEKLKLNELKQNMIMIVNEGDVASVYKKRNARMMGRFALPPPPQLLATPMLLVSLHCDFAHSV
ncbi:hypothetical protein HPB50_022822 [Hyalomma asiaticum]|uniref:Uncharacterized protein n=1 Tax=Hyalomma asiaticum TaxID=266040 RepID=A0ACB7TRT6_HYAAI|nr:hypothetical protein HPB50_022822 [Hyalomma asiaticum]